MCVCVRVCACVCVCVCVCMCVCVCVCSFSKLLTCYSSYSSSSSYFSYSSLSLSYPSSLTTITIIQFQSIFTSRVGSSSSGVGYTLSSALANCFDDLHVWNSNAGCGKIRQDNGLIYFILLFSTLFSLILFNFVNFFVL